MMNKWNLIDIYDYFYQNNNLLFLEEINFSFSRYECKKIENNLVYTNCSGLFGSRGLINDFNTQDTLFIKYNNDFLKFISNIILNRIVVYQWLWVCCWNQLYNFNYYFNYNQYQPQQIYYQFPSWKKVLIPFSLKINDNLTQGVVGGYVYLKF